MRQMYRPGRLDQLNLVYCPSLVLILLNNVMHYPLHLYVATLKTQLRIYLFNMYFG